MRVAGLICLFALNLSAPAADLADLRKQAAAGDAEAQYQLGERHHEGREIDRDVVAARKWVKQAANQKHARAQYRLASMLLMGEGGPRNGPAGLALFRECLPALTKEAEGGLADAQGKLGILYARGVAVEANAETAAQWFRKAATQGNAKAQADLGSAYLAGQGVEANPTEAGRWLERAARAGHGPAMIHLASLELQGRGRRQNVAVGKQWLMKAALVKHPQDAARARTLLDRLATQAPRLLPKMDPLIARAKKGQVEAQLELARRHESGEGLPVDVDRAAHWYHHAAALGSAEGAHRLGGMLALGRGLKKDAARAGRLWRLAASLGYPAAQIDWGVMCAKGEGVPRNAAEAYYWFVVARRLVSDPRQIESLDALQTLSATELSADEVFDIPKHAANYIVPQAPALRRTMAAAAFGDGAAQMELGQALAAGTGLAKDPARAYVWLSLAAKQKVAKADEARAALELSDADKAAAEQRIKAFIPLAPPKKN